MTQYHNHSKLYKFTIHNMGFIAYNLVYYIIFHKLIVICF